MQSFNERVYALVRLIPPGKVLSYGRIAALLNKPRGARAVGWAMNALPAGSDVPWHRVVNAAGRISLRGDILSAHEQRALLEAEGIHFDAQDELKLLDFRHTLWRPSPWEIRALVDSDDPDDSSF
jgi:methylated-DNA-protein-cysteine methyltransferase-like protein